MVNWLRSFYLRFGLSLMVEIRFGLSYLRFPPPEIRVGLFAYGSPRPEIGFGLFLLTVPPP